MEIRKICAVLMFFFAAIVIPINALLICKVLGWQAVVIWVCGYIIFAVEIALEKVEEKKQ